MGCVQCVKGGVWVRDLVCFMEVGVRVWGKCCCIYIYMKLVIGWYVGMIILSFLLFLSLSNFRDIARSCKNGWMVWEWNISVTGIKEHPFGIPLRLCLFFRCVRFMRIDGICCKAAVRSSNVTELLREFSFLHNLWIVKFCHIKCGTRNMH